MVQLRNSVPPPVIEIEVDRMEDGEQAWHPDGADVPDAIIAAALTGASILLGLLLVLASGAHPANQPERSGQSATPTTYGAPRGW